MKKQTCTYLLESLFKIAVFSYSASVHPLKDTIKIHNEEIYKYDN